MNEREQPVMAVLEAYRAAVLAKDVDAFVALYDEDVCVFDMWGRWSYEGLAAWREMVADWFGSLGSERVALDMSDVRTVVTDDLAVTHALVTFRGLSAEGDELRAMNNRLTWVLERRSGEAWRIVHEHTSAPADFETAKLILQR
jgi:uncharacterized protein (TIGR02246 family)